MSKRLKEWIKGEDGLLIPYITGGFPSLNTTKDLILALQDAGAGMIEIGIPFSDPMADGPVIQYASQKALDAGVTPGSILEAISGIKKEVEAPLIAMTYYNPVFRMGNGKFASYAKEAGFSGVIIPDLPPEEGRGWIEAAKRADVDTIFLVAPTTPAERMRLISYATTGFIYYVSLKGVTGSKLRGVDRVKERVMLAREVTRLPVCVGFGVSNHVEVKGLWEVAQGVIVGSALVKALEEGGRNGMIALFKSLLG